MPEILESARYRSCGVHLALPSYSSGSPSNKSLSIILKFYYLSIAYIKLCENVLLLLIMTIIIFTNVVITKIILIIFIIIQR